MSQSSPITISKRRLMLYKAIQEFPDNQRIRNALLHTYNSSQIQVAAKNGVFIHYNRSDELFALELDTQLRKAGINVWMDQIDINPDEDWDYAISNAISRSGVMILVLSPHAIEDTALHQEAIKSLELGNFVIPIIHQACDYENLDLILPPIDFSDDFDKGLQFLLKGLKSESAVNV